MTAFVSFFIFRRRSHTIPALENFYDAYCNPYRHFGRIRPYRTCCLQT
ncbi:hypothetical protein [Neisseria sicca]|nr:hypothetical protein [Neisseria sicca]